MITRAFNFIRLIISVIIRLYFTIIGRIYARLFGVDKLGKEVKFYGLPKIQKARKGILTIGDNCTFRSQPTFNLIGINRPCILSVQHNAILKIGNSCGFSGTVIGSFNEIIFENNVRCGANTLITGSDWHLDDFRSDEPRPIYIEKNVWLGVYVTVMKGVRIGKNTVIGAGSIVTKDIPSNVVAAGNPGKVIKQLEEK